MVVIKQNGRGRIVSAAEDRGINAPLYAALLAAEDTSGVLAADLRRFLEATESESREAANQIRTRSPAIATEIIGA